MPPVLSPADYTPPELGLAASIALFSVLGILAVLWVMAMALGGYILWHAFGALWEAAEQSSALEKGIANLERDSSHDEREGEDLEATAQAYTQKLKSYLRN